MVNGEPQKLNALDISFIATFRESWNGCNGSSWVELETNIRLLKHESGYWVTLHTALMEVEIAVGLFVEPSSEFEFLLEA